MAEKGKHSRLFSATTEIASVIKEKKRRERKYESIGKGEKKRKKKFPIINRGNG